MSLADKHNDCFVEKVYALSSIHRMMLEQLVVSLILPHMLSRFEENTNQILRCDEREESKQNQIYSNH